MMVHTDIRTGYTDAWTHSYCLFPRRNLKDKWVRGWLYKHTMQIMDYGYTMQFKYFFTKKDYFEFRLKGQHNR